jgi:hypothetical protein
LARLSGPHGYQFDGDTVHLNAMFALLDPVAHERSWALQLWACATAPASAKDLAGHIVAEVPLPPMGELADETEHFEVSAFALPPVSGNDHAMVLVLASGRAGQFDDVHDFAVYPNRQQFIQPRLSGNAGYRIDGARVQLCVDRVENPRAEGNRSGTLSLELWALSAPFEGGRFHGHHLAGVEIGSVNGQDSRELQPNDLAFTPPPAGTWQIVLMLREWTANGFVTRDFANFAVPFVSAPVVEKAPAPAAAKPVVPTPENPAALVVAKAPAPVAVPPKIAVPPVVATVPAPVAVVPMTTVPPVAKTATPAVPAAPAKAPAVIVPKGVSVNTAPLAELAAVKGLSTKLAEGIVKKRPFTSLDELGRVKGFGEKLLAKVRSSLRL